MEGSGRRHRRQSRCHKTLYRSEPRALNRYIAWKDPEDKYGKKRIDTADRRCAGINDDSVTNDDSAKDAQELQDLSIEEAFSRLQELLEGMENEGTTLEQSFASYEEGMKLLRYCNEKIDRVEQQVQKMNADGSLEAFEA